MKGFEPQPHPATIAEEEQRVRGLDQFSSVELLLELRRRKVLGRVSYHNIAPGYSVTAGYSLRQQINCAYKGLAQQLSRAHTPESQPPGCSVKFVGPPFHRNGDTDRQVDLVLNYVVDHLR